MKTFLAILFLFTYATGAAQTISGYVFDGPAKKDIPFATVELLDVSMKRKSITAADYQGVFSFKKITPGEYAIRVSCVGYGDTLFKNIRVTGDTTLQLDAKKYCQYDAKKNDKTCPKCGKKNQVIPIVYGLIVLPYGEDYLEEPGETFYPGGCVISHCDPNWYCKRDKIKF